MSYLYPEVRSAEASAAHAVLLALADACEAANDAYGASVVRGIAAAIIGDRTLSTDDTESTAQSVTLALLRNS